MSKYCKNCGSIMNDEDKVCSSCGTFFEAPVGSDLNPVSPAVPQSGSCYNAGQIPDAPAKSGTKKYLPIIIGAIVAVVIVVVIVLFATGVFSKSTSKASDSSSETETESETVTEPLETYEDAVKGIFIAYATGDTELMLENISLMDNSGIEISDDDRETIKEVVEDVESSLEESLGGFESVDLEITDEEDLDVEEIEEIYSEYIDTDADGVVLSLSDITAAKMISFTVTINGENDSRVIDYEDAVVVRENGTWKVIVSSFS